MTEEERVRPSRRWVKIQGSTMRLVVGAAIGTTIFIGALLLGPALQLATPAAAPTPILTLVAFSSPTSRPSLTPVETSTPSPTATREPPEGGGGDFASGQLVEVFGTGGDGLRLRQAPGLLATIQFLGFENEVFEIQEGPADADGFVWWLLVNPFDPTKSGWAVGDFLRPADP